MIRPAYSKAFAVTVNDDPAAFAHPPFVGKAIYVGVTGNIKLTTSGGQTVTFLAVPVGMLWVQANHIFDTGTTATDMVILGD